MGREGNRWGIHKKRIPPPTNPMMKLLEVQLYGERNYPIGRARVPIEMLQDFESAWQFFKEQYPHYTIEQFLRYVMRMGTASAVHNVVHCHIPPPESVPSP